VKSAVPTVVSTEKQLAARTVGAKAEMLAGMKDTYLVAKSAVGKVVVMVALKGKMLADK
jgi:hypothetical protein